MFKERLHSNSIGIEKEFWLTFEILLSEPSILQGLASWSTDCVVVQTVGWQDVAEGVSAWMMSADHSTAGIHRSQECRYRRRYDSDSPARSE